MKANTRPMKGDPKKTKGQLISENEALRIRVGELERDGKLREEFNIIQDRFQVILNNIPHTVVIKDAEARYLFANKAWCETYGVSLENIVNKTAMGIPGRSETERIDVLKSDRDFYDSSETQVEYEHQRTDKEGKLLTMQNIRSKVFDKDGNLSGMVIIAYDISRQREVEEQLRESQKMEAVGQLAGGIAHEFNNNLQIMINGVQFARNNIRDPDMVEKFLDMTLKSAERSAELTKQLLAFSRKTPLIPTAVDLNDLITDLTWLVRPIIGTDIDIGFDPAGDLVPVIADDGLIKQALINLSINARDAMPDGGRLVFKTSNHHADQDFCDLHGCKQLGDYAMISVSDSGIGMSAEIREHIFEPFFTTKDVGKGTGLGLAMVHGIVQQHDGAIEAISEPGGGTTFNIYLPKADSPVATKITAAVGDSPGGSETILVAEDEENVRELLVRMLESKGYQVLAAEDGEKALSVFKANPQSIDLVILDMVMPKLSGRKVFEQIRESGSDVPVLFSSGYSLDSSDIEFTSGKGVHTIQKPYASSLLFTTVREVLDQQ